MTTNEKWIECRIYPGMFSDERAVEVRGRSYFVDKTSVRTKSDERSTASSGQKGELRVRIVEDRRSGKRWAILPTSARDSFEAE